jgi:hypothetical protein
MPRESAGKDSEKAETRAGLRRFAASNGCVARGCTPVGVVPHSVPEVNPARHLRVTCASLLRTLRRDQRTSHKGRLWRITDEP